MKKPRPAWLDRGFPGIRQVFSRNLQLSAVRTSALPESLPLGMLALAAEPPTAVHAGMRVALHVRPCPDPSRSGCRRLDRLDRCGRGIPLRLRPFWRRILSRRRHVPTPVHMERQEGDLPALGYALRHGIGVRRLWGKVQNLERKSPTSARMAALSSSAKPCAGEGSAGRDALPPKCAPLTAAAAGGAPCTP